MSEASAFQARHCPACSTADHRVLLRVSARQIVESNWSYRTQEADRLPADPTSHYPIQQCSTCGFIYAGLLPDDAFLARVYDSVIDAHAAEHHNLGHAAMAGKMAHLATFLRLLGTSDRVRVLDFGCGFGPSLALLAAIPTVDVLGFETSASRLARLAQHGLPATSSEHEMLARGPYDGILIDNVLEHLPDPKNTLHLLRRACRPQGIVFVSVPEVGRDAITAVRNDGPLRMDINPWEHLNYFDVRHLDAMLAAAAFAPVPQASLPREVDTGVRPDDRPFARLRNAAASVVRLLRYIGSGEALASPAARFYRAT
jgi:2-polyprenyl-3-methyl-5-hydroxy-6-metoxy-1,4-benzoquinol methylase